MKKLCKTTNIISKYYLGSCVVLIMLLQAHYMKIKTPIIGVSYLDIAEGVLLFILILVLINILELLRNILYLKRIIKLESKEYCRNNMPAAINTFEVEALMFGIRATIAIVITFLI